LVANIQFILETKKQTDKNIVNNEKLTNFYTHEAAFNELPTAASTIVPRGCRGFCLKLKSGYYSVDCSRAWEFCLVWAVRRKRLSLSPFRLATAIFFVK
jgi:hypothetical protein